MSTLKTHLRLRRGTWFGRYQIGTGNMNEVDLQTADKEQAQARITVIARAEYEAANGGRPFTGELQVLPETEPSRHRHVATQPPVTAYQKNSEASYEAHARTAVACAVAERQVDPKAAHSFFDAVSLEHAESVEGALQLPKRVRAALETTSKGVGWLYRYVGDRYFVMPEQAKEAHAELDKIDPALSNLLVKVYKWQPVQDPPVTRAGKVGEAEVGHAVLGAPRTLGGVTQEDFRRQTDYAAHPMLTVSRDGSVEFSDDVEDENLIAQGGGWATFKRDSVWWVQREAGMSRVSFSMHTTDDAVAGARFYEFREKHRSTAIQFLLPTTVVERAEWVKK